MQIYVQVYGKEVYKTIICKQEMLKLIFINPNDRKWKQTFVLCTRN